MSDTDAPTLGDARSVMRSSGRIRSEEESFQTL